MNVDVFLRIIDKKRKKKVFLPIFLNHFVSTTLIMKPFDLLFLFGRPISPLYSMVMAFRASLYRRNILHVNTLPVPVISVGNLTMGGTGKTPAVQMLAKYLQRKGWRPAVVSRGYRGKADKPVNVVSDGRNILLSAENAGDEPYLLATSIPGLVVLTGKKRIMPCRYACDELGCNIIILDDGFQHLSVDRDVNIVLFNATTLAGNSRVFPGGELREPVSALRRADAFLLTGVTTDNAPRADAFSKLLKDKFNNTPVFTSEISVSGISSIKSEEVVTNINKLKFYAFSGIAHPQRFLDTLTSEGLQICGHTSFKDHASYSSDEVNTLTKKAEAAGATGLITTEKDMVKLQNVTTQLPLFYLILRPTPPQELVEFIESAVGPPPQS
jgi:tetraacyldisaccharide 4'-kinase